MHVQDLIGEFVDALGSEKGYSEHTCRAYLNDLEEFRAYGEGRLPADKKGAEDEKPPLAADQIDGLMIRGYLGF